MRYSLGNRFCGVVLGAVLGDRLGLQVESRLQAHLPILSLEDWDQTEPLSSGWVAIAIDGMAQLSQRHQWQVNSSVSQYMDQERLVGMAIAALPLALYFHDNLPQLRQQLQQAVTVWSAPAAPDHELVDALLIPLWAIALALQEQFKPSHLIPDLITDLELGDRYPIAAELLYHLQSLLNQGASLTQFRHELSHRTSSNLTSLGFLSPIASALYGVLTTPDDARLSLLQAVRTPHQPRIVGALTGAITGAYNGCVGLPLRWRCSLPSSAGINYLSVVWNVTSEADLLRWADGLFASWAGVYQPVEAEQDLSKKLAVAASHVLRKRSA